ncbi:MAG TPA: carbohydrate porin [Bryobacteraceae bacterium]
MRIILLTFLAIAGPTAFARDASTTEDVPGQPGTAATTKSFWNRLWVSGQANFIRQQHGAFPAAYSGPNSFQNTSEHATSRVLTLYTGIALTKRLEFLFDVESAGGAGISNALGLAGYTNVDVVRNPTLGSTPYIARIMLHYVLPLSKRTVDTKPNPLSLASMPAVRRLELRAGRMSTADFFDLNSIGSDSRLQFMNWTAVNNGAWDYAADTRGYTYGLYVEYDDRWGGLRFGEMLMPTVANGITLDWNLTRARGENLEIDLNPPLFPDKPSTIRLLSFVNHANMGSYRQAIDGYLSGKDPTPNITEYRKQGRVKYGFGFNVEQQITTDARAYGRLGWNDGGNESFAYTEVDRTASLGADLFGRLWRRRADKIGAAFITNGISGDHRRYLELGGLGFLLGDGSLTYGLEKIFETYYNAQIWRGIYAAADWQHITNPGYNQARGPVSVISFRIHVEGAVPFDKIGRR